MWCSRSNALSRRPSGCSGRSSWVERAPWRLVPTAPATSGRWRAQRPGRSSGSGQRRGTAQSDRHRCLSSGCNRPDEEGQIEIDDRKAADPHNHRGLGRGAPMPVSMHEGSIRRPTPAALSTASLRTQARRKARRCSDGLSRSSASNSHPVSAWRVSAGSTIASVGSASIPIVRHFRDSDRDGRSCVGKRELEPADAGDDRSASCRSDHRPFLPVGAHEGAARRPGQRATKRAGRTALGQRRAVDRADRRPPDVHLVPGWVESSRSHEPGDGLEGGRYLVDVRWVEELAMGAVDARARDEIRQALAPAGQWNAHRVEVRATDENCRDVEALESIGVARMFEAIPGRAPVEALAIDRTGPHSPMSALTRVPSPRRRRMVQPRERG